MSTTNKITDIHCPSCGAPASYDIRKGIYACGGFIDEVFVNCSGQLMAAVNGQTGKVSVRAIEESHYYFLPWWLKSLLATLVISAASFAGFSLFGMERGQSLLMTAVLALFTLIVTLCAYSDTDRLSFRVESGRKIFTSGDEAFTRVGGKLTGTIPPVRNITPPACFAVWFGIACFCTMCYLTAFGFG